tara:strand:+ start:224 stop:952 length:729 start_codon:yes stop_codon:yes gene_type:complete
MKKLIIDNIKTLFYALVIALIIRTFLIQPFYIPSSSMEPGLLVGDRLFVSKYSYGYSRHSFPFSPNFSDNRFFSKKPQRGDVIVFKTPADNRTDYIKRLIGIPGDVLQIIDGDLYLNSNKVVSNKKEYPKTVNCGTSLYKVNSYIEEMPNGKKYIVVNNEHGGMVNTDKFIVPDNHYFFMGDNRDCSKDSRFLGSVGYVHFRNLVGKAQFIFFSNDKSRGSLYQFWKWNQILRLERFFKKIL